MDDPYWTGVDVGGTKILAGVVDGLGEVQSLDRSETPDRSDAPDVVLAAIVAAVDRLRARYDVSAVGVGAAGFVSNDGVVRFAPHVSWRDDPLQARLADALGIPVVVDNDANVTALAELRFGAARGATEMLCITLGTGIGGAIVMGGAVRRGAHGMAGEFGHMQVERGGRECPCGMRGCWEQYTSGSALVRSAHDHGGPVGLSGPEVTEAAARGETWAVDAFADVGGWLGLGVASLCSASDPELVVVGGGLSAAGDLLLGPARAALRSRLPGLDHRPLPRLVAAACGPESGFLGAAQLARETFGG